MLVVSAIFNMAGNPSNFTGSGDEFDQEQMHFPAIDGRSDAKYPETDCVATGITGKRLASIGFECTGGVYVYIISTPAIQSRSRDNLNVCNCNVVNLMCGCFYASVGDGGACVKYYPADCALGTYCTDCGPRHNASVVVGTELTCNVDEGPESIVFIWATDSPPGGEMLHAATPLAGRLAAHIIKQGPLRGNDGSRPNTASCTYLYTAVGVTSIYHDPVGKSTIDPHASGRGAACTRAGRNLTTDDGLRKVFVIAPEELVIDSFPYDQTSEDTAGHPMEKVADLDVVLWEWVECFDLAFVLLRLASFVWATCASTRRSGPNERFANQTHCNQRFALASLVLLVTRSSAVATTAPPHDDGAGEHLAESAQTPPLRPPSLTELCANDVNSGAFDSSGAPLPCSYFEAQPSACASYSIARITCLATCGTCPPPPPEPPGVMVSTRAEPSHRPLADGMHAVQHNHRCAQQAQAGIVLRLTSTLSTSAGSRPVTDPRIPRSPLPPSTASPTPWSLPPSSPSSPLPSPTSLPPGQPPPPHPSLAGANLSVNATRTLLSSPAAPPSSPPLPFSPPSTLKSLCQGPTSASQPNLWAATLADEVCRLVWLAAAPGALLAASSPARSPPPQPPPPTPSMMAECLSVMQQYGIVPYVSWGSAADLRDVHQLYEANNCSHAMYVMLRGRLEFPYDERRRAWETPVWACQGFPSVAPGRGPVCFGPHVPGADWLSLDREKGNISCSRFAPTGRLDTLNCLTAARLLAAAPPVPVGFDLFSGCRYYHYRLSDMFHFGWGYKKTGSQASNAYEYPDSIGFMYLHRARGRGGDWRALMDIVNHRKGDTPPPTALVIHIRTGDVIDGVDNSLLDLLMLGVAWRSAGPQRGIRAAAASWSEWARANPRVDDSYWWNYVKTLNYYKAIVQNGLPAGARSIVLVTGSHWPLSADGMNHFFDDNGTSGTLGSFERSWKYLHVIKGLYEELGFPTTLRMGFSPDDDFVYMGSARYFHPSGGGFSRLVGSLVERKGGQVIFRGRHGQRRVRVGRA